MKTLTRGGVTTREMFGSYYTFSTSTWNHSYDYRSGRQYSSDYEITKGVDTPQYHKKLRSGELLPLNYFEQLAVEAEVLDSEYHFKEDSTQNEFKWDIWLPPYQWILDLDRDITPYVPDDLDDLVQAAYSAVYSRGFDALTFLGEFKQTLKMFNGIYKRLYELFTSPSLAKVLNAWLEGRYGWRPLVGEMMKLNEVLQNFDEERKRVTERVGRSYSVNNTEIPASYGGGLGCDLETVDVFNISARGFVVMDVEVPKIQFNPLVTGWELIPLSFVVDWFLSVGQTLEAISIDLMSRQSTAASGVKIDVTRQVNAINWTPSAGSTKISASFSAISTATYNQRVPRALSYLPQSRINLDGFKLVDLAALLKQRLKTLSYTRL